MNLPCNAGGQGLIPGLGREKKMATHSSVFAWEIPWTEKSGGLQSMGRQRGRHDWAVNKHANRNLLIFPEGMWLLIVEVFLLPYQLFYKS